MSTRQRTEQQPTAATSVIIPAPDMRLATFTVTGTAPYMQHRFGEKARKMMMETQSAGSQAKKGRKRDPRDFEADYLDAMHVFEDGTCGIPASAFRAAMVSACRLVGYKMTLAKLSLFIEHDGLDKMDGTPLVKINGKPEQHIGAARNDNGSCDIRSRPMWRKWTAEVRVKFDAGQFSAQDVANLLQRAGEQVGIGEGRPDSKMSIGMGFGTFTIAD